MTIKRLLRVSLLLLLVLLIAIPVSAQAPISPNSKPKKTTPTQEVKKTKKTTTKPKTESPTTPPSYKGTVNGHEYVDLGLSVKWATCNIGANTPEENGDYFAWGELSTKSEYNKENSISYGNENLGNISGWPQYDAARANWGSGWRLPTKKEVEELLNNCTVEWTTQNGINGVLFLSTKNGQSIFLPAAGFRDIFSLYGVGHNGYYWNSSPDDTNCSYASNIRIEKGSIVCIRSFRSYGYSIRPVIE